MKNVVLILTILIFAGMSLPVQAQKKADKVVCFKSSMHCAGCENTLFELLRFEKGVKDLKLDHVSNTIRVVYSEKKNTDEALAKAVVEKGYKADKITEEAYMHLLDSVKVHPAVP